MDVFISAIQFAASSGDLIIYGFWNAGSFIDYNLIYLDSTHTATEASRKADVAASIAAYATLKGYTVSRTVGLDIIGSDASTHIANATNNLATNFNALSALLGLANGLNDSNAAQNDLATKFNTLIGVLQTHGILLP